MRYPIVEFACGMLFGATAFLYAFPAAGAFAALAFALLVISLVDMQVQEIPDSMLVLIVAAAAFWIIFDPGSISWQEALIGAAAGAIPLFLLDGATLVIFNKDGFGYGDMKLMGAAGLFLGWQGVLAAYFVAFVTGAMAAAYMLKTKKAERGGYMAFGPFLSLGTISAAWSHVFFGRPVLNLILFL